MKKLVFFLIIALFSICNEVIGQTTRSKHVAEDGFEWYKIRQGKLQGAEDKNGKTIVPTKYKFVCYHELADGWFVVKDKKGYEGAYNKDGKYVIPTERKYTYVRKDKDVDGYFYFIKRGGKTGVCDAAGNEIIPPSYKDLIYLQHEFEGRKKGHWGKSGVSLKGNPNVSSDKSYLLNSLSWIFYFDNCTINNKTVNDVPSVRISRNGIISVVLFYQSKRFQFEYTTAYYNEPSEEEKSAYVVSTLGFGSEYDLPSYLVFTDGKSHVMIDADGYIKGKIKGMEGDFEMPKSKEVKDVYYLIVKDVINNRFLIKK